MRKLRAGNGSTIRGIIYGVFMLLLCLNPGFAIEGEAQQSEKVEKAITYINKALEIDPVYITYWYDLARAYKAAGKKQKALYAVNNALELDPKFPNAEDFLKKSGEMKNSLK